MNEELKAIDWLRAKTISYESRSEELHYALILYNLIMNLQKENQELKKDLEDLFSDNSKLRKKLENSMTFQDYEYTLNKKIQLENQQKEFIEYLESEIKRLEENNIYEPLQRTALATFQHVLSKYKEIIGVKNE